MALGTDYNLYVCEYNNHRVKIFKFSCNLTATVPTSVITCEGEEAVLSMTASEESATINWYDSADSDVPVFTGANFTPTGLTETKSYWVEATNFSCTTERTEVVLTILPAPVPPEAVAVQYFEEGGMLADLEVAYSGTLTWYADEALTVVLPDTTLLTSGTVYYVTQTNEEGCTSGITTITAETSLGIFDSTAHEFTAYPNPVSDVLNLSGSNTITGIAVLDMSGRLVEQNVSYTSSEARIDLSNLATGSYLVKVTSGDKNQYIRILKE